MKQKYISTTPCILEPGNCKQRFMLLRFFILLCLTFSNFFAHSQRQPLKFEHITTNLGLSQSNVICIFQDSRGFMWFGTRDGLNKYDGYKFTVFKKDASNVNSLSHNMVQDIAEDADGNLWIGTWGGGLNRFDWKKETFHRYLQNNNDQVRNLNTHINKIYKDSDENLWIASENGGLSLYDKENDSFISFLHNQIEQKSIAEVAATDIVEDRDGFLWVATSTGLDKFDRQSKSFTHFRNDPARAGSLSSDNLSQVFIDSKKRLWVGTKGAGLELFNPQTEEFSHFRAMSGNSQHLQSNAIKAINEDDNGRLWVGTENGGLAIYDENTGGFETYFRDDVDLGSLNSNSIWSLCRDAKGNMWAGTHSSGINLLSRDAGKFIHYRHTSSSASLNNNDVLSIYEDSKSNLWVGTDGGGLNLFDYNKGTFTSYMHDPLDTNSLSGNYILDLFEDHKGDLWIGTWDDGVTVFNKEKNTFKRFKYDPNNPKGICSPNVWTIFEDSDKNMWLGTYSAGLSRYDRDADEFTHFRNEADASSLSNNTINVIYEDSRRNLWVGTNGSGLDLFDKKSQTFSHFIKNPAKNSISSNDIYCIIEDPSGNLWIGTDVGLNKMDKEGKFTTYHTKDGLPSDIILGVLVDKKGLLWVSTFNGVSKFNPFTRTFTNFSTNDGLQSREFKMSSCVFSRRGKMYFGGVNGFNEFAPDALREKKYDPPLVFTDFLVFNKHATIGDDNNSVLKETITNTRVITLPHDQSVITFEFASLNYTIEGKKQYSYFLEGFDADWNYVGHRHSATYTNLNPGKYVFKVRKLNNEGQWSLEIASIQLIITPPFWMTWWFRLAALTVIAGVILLIYRLRVRAIKAQGVRLQQLVNEKTSQLLQSTAEEHKARQEAEDARQEAEIANQSLERKNKELEQFAYVASHDMQEPLRTTTSYVGLLQKQYTGMLDERADKYLTYIVQSSDRMKVLIKDLLDFSRIGVKATAENVDCNLIVENVVQDLAVAIQESGAKINSCRLPVITGYPTEIKQLFQNLIVNAIKFRKKDIKPEIKICAQDENGCWRFSVSDNGIGIDQKHSEKIFIIFQRLHSRTVYEGSGIGLAHCKKIVELHGGKIWVESEISQGCTFHFTIAQTTASR
jgi:signal transduction histidine kinase/ligand-binding sensor domain-containing protein